MKNGETKITENEDISKYLSFGIGGKVKYFTNVINLDGIISAIKFAKERKIPYFILGGGYNIVFSDKKWNGIVIKILGGEIKQNGNIVICDAGGSLSSLIEFTTTRGLSGLETLSGIPGTIGGAIYGNAGAYGHSISESVNSVIILDGRGMRKISKVDCKFNYRDSIFKKKKWVILGVEFKLDPGESKDLIKKSNEIISIRIKKFSEHPKCAGSYFKNILANDVSAKTLKLIDNSKIIDGKIPTGYLLESVGAKGMKIGGVYISDCHANIILNDGTGKYSDLKKLVTRLKKLVKNKFGILLEEEVVEVKQEWN